MRARAVKRLSDEVNYSETLSKLLMWVQREDALRAVGLTCQQEISISRDCMYYLLQGCIRKRDLEGGRYLHSLVIRIGYDSITVLEDHLIHLFASCGCLRDAYKVFCQVSKPSVYTWNAVISAHCKLAGGEKALELYYEMHQDCIRPNIVTFLCTLNACGSIRALEKGSLIHDKIVRKGLDSNLVIGNALIHMHSKCGGLAEAWKVFDELPNQDVVSWGTIISGYAQHGHEHHALDLLAKMQQEGIEPEKVTFLCILKACGSAEAIWHGRLIHDQIHRSGIESDVVIGSTLIDMYAKCKSLDEAHRVLERLPDRNVVSWCTTIAGYVEQGDGFVALELFKKMKDEGVKPDKVTFLCILKACSIIGIMDMGRLIHEEIIKCRYEFDLVVGSAIVNMYSKCGSMGEACMVFDKLPCRDVVTWAVIIAGYAQYGQGLSALEIFREMQMEGVKPDKVTFLGIFKACGSIGALEIGRQIHDQAIQCAYELDMVIGNTIVDMYGKCGSLAEARNVFDKLPNQDEASWGAMIAGFSQTGNLRLAQKCLEGMLRQGLSPGVMIFTSILTACNHAGLLEDGWAFFKLMKEDYEITPSIEHLNCMMDLLGRSGHLHEADELIQTMPSRLNVVGWMALLAACRIYGNVDLGRQCCQRVVQLDPNESSGYVLMSSIYAGAHMWDDADRLQDLRKCANALKKPGTAWIEVSNKIFEFLVGCKSNYQNSEILSKLEVLYRPLKEGGYVAQLESVLEPILG